MGARGIAALSIAFSIAAIACDQLGGDGGTPTFDGSVPPPNPPPGPPPPPPPRTACIVDNQYCYDSVTDTRCQELGAIEGKVMFFDGSTCADRAYVETCGDRPGKFQTCPSSGASGACVVADSYCYQDLTSEACRNIGRTEGNVMYWDTSSCADRSYGIMCPDRNAFCPGQSDAGIVEDAGATDTGTSAPDASVIEDSGP